MIRFERVRGQCEVCARPHGQRVFYLGDGRWWDSEYTSWRNGAGRFICLPGGADDVLESVRTTRITLATGHRVHDPANNAAKNLAALRQRCHTYRHCRGHAGGHENGCVHRDEAGGKDDPRRGPWAIIALLAMLPKKPATP